MCELGQWRIVCGFGTAGVITFIERASLHGSKRSRTKHSLSMMRMIAEHIHLNRRWNHADDAGRQLSAHVLRKCDQRFTLCRRGLLVDKENRLRGIGIRIWITERGICLHRGNHSKTIEFLSVPAPIPDVPCEQRLIPGEPYFTVREALSNVDICAAALEIIPINLLSLGREGNGSQNDDHE